MATLDTTATRAKQSGVGQRTQQLADKLVKEAPAELVKEVIDGKKSLNKAIKEITPPKPPVIKPESVPIVALVSESTQDEQLNSLIDEQQGAIQALEADNKAMLKVFESDDRLFTSVEEVKSLTEQNRLLTERINVLMDENQEVIKAVSYWKDRFLTLEETLTKELAS